MNSTDRNTVCVYIDLKLQSGFISAGVILSCRLLLSAEIYCVVNCILTLILSTVLTVMIICTGSVYIKLPISVYSVRN